METVPLAYRVPLYTVGALGGLCLAAAAAAGVHAAVDGGQKPQPPVAQSTASEATASPGATSGGTGPQSSAPASESSASHAHRPATKSHTPAPKPATEHPHGGSAQAQPREGASGTSQRQTPAPWAAGDHAAAARDYTGAPVGTGRHRGAGPVDAGGYADPRDTVHRIVAGDTLWDLSRRYGVSVALLAQYNGVVNPDLIYAGDVLRVPYTGADY